MNKRFAPHFDSIQHAQAEHNLYVLSNLAKDLMDDWANPTSHRALIENFHIYEKDFAAITQLAEYIRNAGTAVRITRNETVDLRRLANGTL